MCDDDDDASVSTRSTIHLRPPSRKMKPADDMWLYHGRHCSTTSFICATRRRWNPILANRFNCRPSCLEAALCCVALLSRLFSSGNNLGAIFISETEADDPVIQITWPQLTIYYSTINLFDQQIHVYCVAYSSLTIALIFIAAIN